MPTHRKRQRRVVLTHLVRPMYVAYYRVSTEGQERSGLGLDDQRAIVRRHVESVGGELREEFTEVIRGWKADRPVLAAAMTQCRISGATLIVAKLDRLTRTVEMTIQLVRHSGLQFYFCDLYGWGSLLNDPAMDWARLIDAAKYAEIETIRMGSRIKGAIDSKKRKVGRSNMGMDNRRTRSAVRRAAKNRPAKVAAERRRVAKLCAPLKAKGWSAQQMADHLNRKGVRTGNGRTWTGANLWRVLKG